MKQIVSWKAIWEQKDLLLKGAVVLLIAIVALFVFAFQGKGEEDITVSEEDANATTEISETEENDSYKGAVILVDVSGAVKHPAVVEVPEGSRITDAIEKAGGLTEEADISQINRAAFLTDGEKVYIPDKRDLPGNSAEGSAVQSGKISINTADAATLEELSGIGPVTAASIIAYRTENGRFQKLEDLMEVSGIGEKTYEKIKSEIML